MPHLKGLFLWKNELKPGFNLVWHKNVVAILHSHKEIVDLLWLVAISNDLLDNLPNRRNNLGIFPGSDLHNIDKYTDSTLEFVKTYNYCYVIRA